MIAKPFTPEKGVEPFVIMDEPVLRLDGDGIGGGPPSNSPEASAPQASNGPPNAKTPQVPER
jgi:hypothetical protein